MGARDNVPGLAARLREIRERAGLTQQEAADRSGVHAVSIARFETEVTTPTLRALYRLAEAYGLWYGRRWAWILGMMSAGLYLPVEIFELIKHVNAAELLVFTVNILILVVLWRGRAAKINDHAS